MTELFREDPVELRRTILSALRRTAGSPRKTARLLGVSYTYFWWMLTRLEMRAVPREVYAEMHERFRLLPPGVALKRRYIPNNRKTGADTRG